VASRKRKNAAAGGDATEMLEAWTRDDVEMQALLAEERSKAAIARQIYDLRTARGLTQRQLAERIGTQQPVIARLEDADYRGHSLKMLYRVAAALGCRVSLGLVPRPRAERAGGRHTKRK
jgi:ribosome-binding protein aMBF1 (putative translation factor)